MKMNIFHQIVWGAFSRQEHLIISPFYQRKREMFKRVEDHLCLSRRTQYLCCRQYLVLLVAQSVSQLSTLSVTVAPPSPIQHTRKIGHQPQPVVTLHTLRLILLTLCLRTTFPENSGSRYLVQTNHCLCHVQYLSNPPISFM